MNKLPPSFFLRPVTKIAKDLLGCYLVRKRNGKTERHIITEVEAYDGEKDLACHASKGKTKRNCVMFEPGGVWYVYLIYGFHDMLNIVTGNKDYPAAVLIRGVEGILGPGRLTRKLGIDRSFNGKKASPTTGLWIEKGNVKGKITRTPRIGVDYAGPIWSKKKYRFVLTLPKK